MDNDTEGVNINIYQISQHKYPSNSSGNILKSFFEINSQTNVYTMCVQKVSRLKLYVLRQKWTIN